MPVTNAGGSGVAAGTVAHFAAATAPSGWLKANGAAISRAIYAKLFTAIGTTYGGGDGSTTFNVPDLRGEFLRSLDDGRGVDSGREIGTAQIQQMERHTHAQQVDYFHIGSSYGTSLGRGTQGNGNASIGFAGGTSNNNETRPRNIAMLACIKY